MDTIRKKRKEYQSWGKGYYHLSTDGRKDGKLFYSNEQFAYGMTLIGLLTLRFAVIIYDFVLMDNHIHLLLSGTGAECVRAFDYLRRKISARLVKDGYAPLPKDYFFKLTPVKDEEQMRVNYLYIDRNVLERGSCTPFGYPWGAAYLHHSFWSKYLTGEKAETLCKYTELEKITGSRISIPSEWRFHPELGLLPDCFIDKTLFARLFPDPKMYLTRLVKDYEAFVRLGRSLDETVCLSADEIRNLVRQITMEMFAGKAVQSLTNNEKGRLCVVLDNQFQLSSSQIAAALNMPEYLVKQFLSSKDYGKKKAL